MSHNLDGAATTNDVTQSFGYNPAGQITTRGLSNNSFAFTNRVNVNRSYAANGLNQYTSAGPANFAYDANGNLTSDGSVTYSYDTENRLVGASGAKTASLLYDPLGRLVRTHNGNTANARWFVYDGNEMVAEYDGSGNMLKRYLHGPGVDEPLAWFDGPTTDAANRHDMFADHQGSIVAVTSNTGATESLNRYDEFGIPGPGQTSRFQYTGQTWLPELGAYYYKARIYSPTLGRFMQTDPIGYSDGPNWYNYVGSDPVNRTDPSGLCGSYQDWLSTGLILCSRGTNVVGLSGVSFNVGVTIPSFSAGVGIPPVAPPTTSAEPLPQNGHDYRTKNQVCARAMTNAEKKDLLSRFGAPTPTAGMRHPASGINIVAVGGALPGGIVRTTFSADGLSVTNVTTPVHAFVGVIQRTISSSGKDTSISTHGYGDAGGGFIGSIRDWANGYFGPEIFDSLDSNAAAYAAAKYPGC